LFSGIKIGKNALYLKMMKSVGLFLERIGKKSSEGMEEGSGHHH
jgi:hypothetical protein